MDRPILPGFDSRWVDGHGDKNSRSFVLGEAPGAEEAEAGIPFIGASGRRFNEALAKNSVSRSEIYVTNAVKQRPERNRTPNYDEIDVFFPVLEKEIALLDPVCVLALGKVAFYAITGMKGNISNQVGAPLAVGRSTTHPLIVFPNYHPAATIYDRSKLELFENTVSDYVRIWKFGLRNSFEDTWQYAVGTLSEMKA